MVIPLTFNLYVTEQSYIIGIFLQIDLHTVVVVVGVDVAGDLSKVEYDSETLHAAVAVSLKGHQHSHACRGDFLGGSLTTEPTNHRRLFIITIIY